MKLREDSKSMKKIASAINKRIEDDWDCVIAVTGNEY